MYKFLFKKKILVIKIIICELINVNAVPERPKVFTRGYPKNIIKEADKNILKKDENVFSMPTKTAFTGLLRDIII